MKCEICKKRKADITFCSSALEMSHGFTQEICRLCYIKIMEDIIKECEDGIKRERKVLDGAKSRLD